MHFRVGLAVLSILLLFATRLDAQSLYDSARAALRRNQLDSAYELAQRAARAEPNRAEVQELLGDAACSKAQRASRLAAFAPARRCKEAYSRAVALQPDNADYLESLAQYLSQAPGIAGGDRDSALALAARVQRMDEGRGTQLMVNVLLRGGAREKARADSVVDAFARRHPGDRVVQIRVANHYARTGRPERALAISEQLLATEPGDVLARFGVARNLVELKRDPRRALELLRAVTAAPRPPDNQPTYSAGAPWWRIGQAFVQLGLVDSARAAFEQALRVNPQFAQARRSLDSLSHRP